MHDACTVSIILPTLNSERFLPAALESLQPLRARGACVIVVDSDSEDATPEIARAMADHLLRFPRGNMYAAIDHGIKFSDTEWVGYLNSDDLVFPDALLAGLSACSQSYDLIYGNLDFIDEAGRFLHDYFMPPPEDILPLAAMGINAIPPQGTIFRKSAYDQLGGFDATLRLAGDFDFFTRATVAGFKICQLTHPSIAAFRIHGTQLSNVRQQEHAAEVKRIASNLPDPVSRKSRWLAFLRFKLRNATSLLTRVLRGKMLHGRMTLRECMAVSEPAGSDTP